MQYAQAVYLCEPVLLWLNASLCFHMQFTEDIYLRVNQTRQQNPTQDNKTFICKLSRRQDKRVQTKRSAKPTRSCSCLTAPVKRDEYAGYDVDKRCRFSCGQFSFMLVAARLGLRWMYIGGSRAAGWSSGWKWNSSICKVGGGRGGRPIDSSFGEGVATCGGQQASASASSALQCSWLPTSCVAVLIHWDGPVQCSAMHWSRQQPRKKQSTGFLRATPACNHAPQCDNDHPQEVSALYVPLMIMAFMFVHQMGHSVWRKKLTKFCLCSLAPYSGYVPSVFCICVRLWSVYVLVLFWLCSV